MKKTTILILAALAVFPGCAQKKNRLTANTLVITMDPSTDQTVASGGTLRLTAICKSAKSDSVDISPVWTIDSGLGSLANASGKANTFTAGTTAGTGGIYATYGDVTSSVTVTVSVSGGGGGGGTSYSIYNSGVFNPDLAAPGTFASAFGADGITLASDLVNHSATQTQSFKATFTLTNAALSYAGWYVSQSAAAGKDMSAYSAGHIKFDIASSTNVQIGIRSKNINSNTNTAKAWISSYGMVFDGSFHSISIPVNDLVSAQAGTDLTQMIDMFITAVIAGTPPKNGTSTNTDYWIDNIRWTSD